MKEIKLPTGEYLLVEVSEEAARFYLVNYDGLNVVWRDKNDNDTGFLEIPPGQWSIIGKADELTEEQWENVVESFEFVHSDKTYNNYGIGQVLNTATESGKSLLAHHGYELNKTIILRKD